MLTKKTNSKAHPTQKKKRISEKSYSQPLAQTGTGLHLDSWPYNLWEKLNPDYTYDTLDRFRPFQSMLCLSDGHQHPYKEEGGLELIPGFPSIATEYFKATDVKYRDGQLMREKNPWVSPYHVKFSSSNVEDKPLFGLIRKVKRVPMDWNLSNESNTATNTVNEPTIFTSNNQDDDPVEKYLDYLTSIVKEHDKIPYVPIKKGDFIIFDMRIPHQNSNSNQMHHPRCAFYHAYSMVHDVNRKTIETLCEKRKNFEHPDDFSSSFKMEQELMNPNNPNHLISLTPLGECLYNEKNYEETILLNSIEELDGGQQQLLPSPFDKLYQHSHVLSKRHLEFFHRYGYVVVENAISDQICNQLLEELGDYSKKSNCPLPVDTIIKNSEKHEKMNVSKGEFRNISNPFGAMVEFYHLPTQQQLRMNEILYIITVKLLSNTWCSNLNISKELQQLDSISYQSIPHWKYSCPMEHELDPRKLWLYVDRMNFRLPDIHKK